MREPKHIGDVIPHVIAQVDASIERDRHNGRNSTAAGSTNRAGKSCEPGGSSTGSRGSSLRLPTCQRCGKTITRRDNSEAQYRRRKYCSRDCAKASSGYTQSYKGTTEWRR